MWASYVDQRNAVLIEVHNCIVGYADKAHIAVRIAKQGLGTFKYAVRKHENFRKLECPCFGRGGPPFFLRSHKIAGQDFVAKGLCRLPLQNPPGKQEL